ncbi:hypothetical protein CROQUDRAFT_103197, partial [Cronartium quercuum f. sp. fusiforme G11]
ITFYIYIFFFFLQVISLFGSSKYFKFQLDRFVRTPIYSPLIPVNQSFKNAR